MLIKNLPCYFIVCLEHTVSVDYIKASDKAQEP